MFNLSNKKTFNKNKSLDYLILLLTIIVFFSFLIGFYYEENSAGGAGGLDRDFANTWNNLNTFLNFELSSALNFVETGDRNFYISSRTPFLYILNAKLNPFTYSVEVFIRSIFLLSIIGFMIFYYTLSISYSTNKIVLLLLASCLLLSPYYRTSAFWGAEENYGIISTIIAFLFFYKFSNSQNNLKKRTIYFFFLIFFSALCPYFDQKLLIIPALIFLKIITSKKYTLSIKVYTFLFYLILALPFLYLVYSWGSIIPTGDSIGRKTGENLFIYNPAYAVTIIAFYLFPILFFEIDLKNKAKNILNNRLYKFFIFLFILYLFYLFYSGNFSTYTLGKGFIDNLVIVLTKNQFFQKVFIFASSLVSFVIILIYSNNNLIRNFFFFYLIIYTIFVDTIYQEYYDPLVFIVCFIFFNVLNVKKFKINHNFNVFFIFTYLLIFLITANIYYKKILI